jgi:hypothetical protein
MNSRRIFNGKGSGNDSISIGHELGLMDQAINPYIATIFDPRSEASILIPRSF